MRILLLLVLCPVMAFASAGGTWQASGVGPTLSHRGVMASSMALKPPSEARGRISLVVWRYQLVTPGIAGLVVKLCSLNRCVTLDGQSGSTLGLAGEPANQPLQFVWGVTGRGTFYPPLQVSSNQVIVNYTP